MSGIHGLIHCVDKEDVNVHLDRVDQGMNVSVCVNETVLSFGSLTSGHECECVSVCPFVYVYVCVFDH